MTSLDRLRQQVPAIHEEFFAACRAAELARPREQHAATTIQKYARGFITRLRLDRLSVLVINIQRAWRGYLGRQRALLARQARDKLLREEYFACMATTIQRHWRGFWSRKYIFDFGARRQYLSRVAEVNTKMRAVLAEEGERAAHEQKALAQATARAAFEDRLSKLHHLISTSSQPGIFASPYAIAAGTLPVIAGQPVEQHLKAAFKKTVPAAAAARTSPARSGHTFLPPIKAATTGGGGGRGLRAGPAVTLPARETLHHHAPPPPVGSGQEQAASSACEAPSSSGMPYDAAGAAGHGPQHQQEHTATTISQGGMTSTGPVGTTNTALSPTGRGPSMHSTGPGSLQAYPSTVLMQGLGQVVPRHTTLRQSVPYDVVHQAQVLDQKVTRAEMMMRHPQPFSHSLRLPEQPTLPTQSNRNLESYQDPWDPTVGGRTETFTPQQQALSPTRFGKYPSKQAYFDAAMLPDADALPLPSYQKQCRQLPGPAHAAGLSNAEVRARALKPAR